MEKKKLRFVITASGGIFRKDTLEQLEATLRKNLKESIYRMPNEKERRS